MGKKIDLVRICVLVYFYRMTNNTTIKVDTEILKKVKKRIAGTETGQQEFYDLAVLHLLQTKETTHYRSAKTGKYIKKKFAEKHLSTTVKETD